MFFTLSSYGINLDSLQRVVDAMPDNEEKVNYLYDLAIGFELNDINQKLKLCDQGIEISKKIEYDRGEVVGLRKRAFVFRAQNLLDSAIYYTKKAISKTDTNILGRNLLANHYQELAIIWLTRFEMDSTQKYIHLADSLFQEVPVEFISLNAQYFMMEGELLKAADSYLQIIELKSVDYRLRSHAFANLSIIYYQLKNHQLAINYVDSAISLHQKYNSPPIYLIGPIKMKGTYYCELKEFDTGLQYLKESADLVEQLQMEDAYSEVYVLLGHFSLLKGMEPDQIEPYYLKAIELSQHSQKEMDKYNANLKYFIFLTETNQLGKASKLVNEVEKAALQKLQPPMLYEYYFYLSEYYEKINEYQKSLYYRNKVMNITDSLFNQSTQAEILELNEQYKTKENLAKIELLHEKVERANLNRNYLIIIFSIILLGALLGYNRYRSKVKLKLENQKIRSEKEILELEQRLLQAQMNPHFIFNSLQSIKSFIANNDAKNANKYLTSFAKLMRLILESTRKELISLEDEIEILDHYLKLEQARSNFMFDYQLMEDENVKAQNEFIQLPPMLIQPFVENAIHHGFSHMDEKGSVTIQFKNVSTNNMEVEVIDNGKGFDPSNEFQHKSHKSLATQITQERIEKYNSKFVHPISFEIKSNTLENQQGNGTMVLMNIPIQNTLKEN